jgi:integrase
MSDLVHLRDGDVVLYKLNNSKRWHSRFKINGEWIRKSCKTADLEEAKRKATEAYDEARFLYNRNLPFKEEKLFGLAITSLLNKIDRAISANTHQAIDETHRRNIRKWIEPFWSKIPYSNIDAVKVQEWYDWKQGQRPEQFAKSSLNNHNIALRMCFREAVYLKHMKEGDVPTLTVKRMGRPTQRRGAFTIEEYQRLRKTLQKFRTQETAHNNKELTKQIRQLLSLYCLILANTGIRPGTEDKNLKWKHISTLRHNGIDYTTLYVKGKKQEGRSVVARHRVKSYLEHLKSWQETEGYKRGPEDYVFRLPNGSRPASLERPFKLVLEHAGLERDETGAPRSLYSLRHTYATFRILYGNIDWPTLAKNMGTSLLMLEKHYSHLEPLRAPQRLA